MSLSVLAIFGIALFFGIVFFLEVRIEKRLPAKEAEAEERENWSWPERKVGPADREHVGMDRKAA